MLEIVKKPLFAAAIVTAFLSTTALATPNSVTIKSDGQVVASSLVSGKSSQVTLQVPAVTADTSVELVIVGADGIEVTLSATIHADGSIVIHQDGEDDVSLADYLAEQGLRLHVAVVHGKGFAAKTTGGVAAPEKSQGQVRSDLKSENRADKDSKTAGGEAGVSVDVKVGLGLGIGNGNKPELPKVGGKK
jgi:hypothetical protein